jgi:peptidoglycan/LPS O-acetylase OafA/YrhL
MRLALTPWLPIPARFPAPNSRAKCRDAGIPAAPAFRLGYRPALDGLRGIAVLAVMACHSQLQSVLPGGYLGVDLFFVLSGFLITALLLEEQEQSGTIHLGRFYLRRMLRLFPALLFMLALCSAWAGLRTRPERAANIDQAVMLTLCYCANLPWCWPASMDLLGHTWSLSVEEQFYVVWPAGMLLLLRCGVPRRRIEWLLCLGIAASAALRIWLSLGSCPRGVEAAGVSLPARADALLAGSLLALVCVTNRLPRSKTGRRWLRGCGQASASLLLLLCLTGEPASGFLRLGGYTLVAGLAAILIAAVVQERGDRSGGILGASALVWTGRISYGLYLWHFPMQSIEPKLMHGVLPWSRHLPGFDGLVTLAFTFGAAILSHKLVEQPFLRWKDRFRTQPCSKFRQPC